MRYNGVPVLLSSGGRVRFETQSDQVTNANKHTSPEQNTKQNTLKKIIKMCLKTRFW